MKVSAILKGRVDSNGQQPIQIRINIGKKKTYKPTDIKVDPDLFKKGKVLSKHPRAREYNSIIESKIIIYQAEALEGFKKKTPRTDFYKFVEETISGLTRKPGSLRQYQSQINKLKEFAPSLQLHEINKDFLNNYKAWLKKKGNEVNTVWSSFKFLRKFIKIAKTEKLITDYPFEGYEFPKYESPDIDYLTREEVGRIEKLCVRKDTPPKIIEAGTWFLLGCYTGLRISDIKVFDKKKHIVGGRLVMRTQKTREIVGLPVSQKMKTLFERVDYKHLTMHENTYNDTLKVIAAVTGIEKNLHAHLSRHTCAMLLTDAGVSQEVIAKILGHSDLRSTRVYSKVSNKRVDLEMRKLK